MQSASTKTHAHYLTWRVTRGALQHRRAAQVPMRRTHAQYARAQEPARARARHIKQKTLNNTTQ